MTKHCFSSSVFSSLKLKATNLKITIGKNDKAQKFLGFQNEKKDSGSDNINNKESIRSHCNILWLSYSLMMTFLWIIFRWLVWHLMICVWGESEDIYVQTEVYILKGHRCLDKIFILFFFKLVISFGIESLNNMHPSIFLG